MRRRELAVAIYEGTSAKRSACMRRLAATTCGAIATWRGTEYADVGSLTGPNQMVFEITGKMRLPRIGPASTKTALSG
ncbi:MAG: hypothetical protein ABWY12_16400 [Burkholderiales bacterium]